MSVVNCKIAEVKTVKSPLLNTREFTFKERYTEKLRIISIKKESLSPTENRNFAAIEVFGKFKPVSRKARFALSKHAF